MTILVIGHVYIFFSAMAVALGISSVKLLFCHSPVCSHWGGGSKQHPAVSGHSTTTSPPSQPLHERYVQVAVHVVVGQEGAPSHHHNPCWAHPGGTRSRMFTLLSTYFPRSPPFLRGMSTPSKGLYSNLPHSKG